MSKLYDYTLNSLTDLSICWRKSREITWELFAHSYNCTLILEVLLYHRCMYFIIYSFFAVDRPKAVRGGRSSDRWRGGLEREDDIWQSRTGIQTLSTQFIRRQTSYNFIIINYVQNPTTSSMVALRLKENCYYIEIGSLFRFVEWLVPCLLHSQTVYAV